MIHLQTTSANKSTAPKEKSLNGHVVNSSLHSFTKYMSYDSLNLSSIKVSNIYNKKTANDISFGGLPLSDIEKIKASKSWKFFNNKTFKKFISLADSSQTIFDAIFALAITCVFRPAAIMAQSNEKNKEKNKKAASHSIASGVIGYGFAVALFSPIKKGLDKIKKNPEIYAKKAGKFFKYIDKGMNKSMSSSKRVQTYTMLVNKLTEVFTASVRSAITIALIPYIDKYVLNQIFGSTSQPVTKKELQNPNYKYSFINFKNNQEQSNTFKTFTGAMK